MKDSGQYLVERILEHKGYTGKGKHKQRSKLFFLVKWLGYEVPDWQPWKNLHTNTITHNYMKEIPYLVKLIPERYTDDDIEVEA